MSPDRKPIDWQAILPGSPSDHYRESDLEFQRRAWVREINPPKDIAPKYSNPLKRSAFDYWRGSKA